jgi:RNA polymerase sigma-70 factor (ECF subfamily)
MLLAAFQLTARGGWPELPPARPDGEAVTAGPFARYPCEMDEAALVAAARKNPDAFARLYHQSLPRVYGFALALTHDHDRAEDVTSETFRRALGRFDAYEDRGQPFVAWLFTIARNVVRDAARKAGREVDLAGHDSTEDRWLGEGLVASEAACLVRTHVARLPAAQRRVIVLRYGHDWPYRKVAERMGKSEAAVKQLSYRAVLRLREMMQEDGYHHEPD